MGFDQKERSFESNSEAMGTHVQQTIYGDMGEEIAYQVVERINQIDRLISFKNSASDIAKLNQSAGTFWVDLSKTTLDILNTSVEVSQMSRSAFDPVILPLTALWDASIKNNSRPSEEALQNAVENVGNQNLKTNMDVYRAKLEKPGCGVDLSAIQTGIACDVALETYAQQGASGGIITIGNSVGVYGKKPSNKEWRIAIREPYKNLQSGASAAILKIDSGCVSTISNYQEIADWKNFSAFPVLNPKNGLPSPNNIVSVTVWHKSGKIADALAYACCVLGRENSEYLLKYYCADAVFISDDKKIFATDKLRSRVVVMDKSYSLA